MNKGKAIRVVVPTVITTVVLGGIIGGATALVSCDNNERVQKEAWYCQPHQAKLVTRVDLGDSNHNYWATVCRTSDGSYFLIDEKEDKALAVPSSVK
jgi:hypothetical protein